MSLECNVCLESFVIFQLQNDFRCCAGKFCSSCQRQLKQCPVCRFDPNPPPLPEAKTVPIIYSPGYGAGWSTWNQSDLRKFFRHDETLVELVETNRHDQIIDYVKSQYGHRKGICTLGVKDLAVTWVSPGTEFYIAEDGGDEYIVYNTDNYWLKA